MRLKLLNRQSIGQQYGAIFTLVLILFTASVITTYFLLSETNESIVETENTNAVVVHVNELMSLYQEKYVFIPEYIIEESDARLLDYLTLSSQFVDKAKHVRSLLETEEQLSSFNKIIENNHLLDQYYFTDVVPNVQQINTTVFTELQTEVSQLKSDTLIAGDALIDASIISNEQSIQQANSNIEQTILTLVASVVLSLFVSIILIIWMNHRIKKDLRAVVKTSDAISNGELATDDLTAQASSELKQLSTSINLMKRNLTDILTRVGVLSTEVNQQGQTFVSIAKDVETGSEQVAITIEELANGATSQADEASDISEKTKAFSERIESAQTNSQQLVTFSAQSLETSDDGYQKMQQTKDQMTTITKTVEQSVTKVADLQKDTQEIGKFIGIITDIAEQTNLLALNASIEAARAGESGKGFAVVANEVRKLAENVHGATGNITTLVNHIQTNTKAMVNELETTFSEVNIGKDQMEQSSQQFNKIRSNIQQMTTMVDEISTVINYFQDASIDINGSVENIAAISEQSAAGAEEISASAAEQKTAMGQVATGADSLQASIAQIDQLMAQFTLKKEGDA
ncbi:methyl-accepting chemotaxis protein [Streptohalobacillus salinus]|uniref:Methyl-accepting chemotaxis protein n=1 Tax=Streptohalobacillus salinus TaxID=621096 RepID=A0A2V3W3R4_9BACI|nr:methyl-accepting chemotaxis protein [Streptohalobacillus salinus]PXW87721.1 methyl-accepting chemotaxis protein [Streptohalobacillus salinus]